MQEVKEKKERVLSHTQFRMYDECPRKYWHCYVAPDAKKCLASPDMRDGTELHIEIADAIAQEDYGALPRDWGFAVRSKLAAGWTLKCEWEAEIPTPFVPIKAIIDLLLLSPCGTMCDIIDWKKNYIPDDDAQLRLYAIAASTTWPSIQTVRASYVSIERAAHQHYYYSSQDIEDFYKSTRRKAEGLLNAGVDKSDYVKKPSTACQYCPFAKQCVSEEYVLPFEDMSLDDLINLSNLAAAVDSQVKAHIKNIMLRRNEDRVFNEDGVGYRIDYVPIMKAAKRREKKTLSKSSDTSKRK